MTHRTPKRFKRKVSLTFPEPTLTEASHGPKTRISNILKQFEQTGLVQHINTHKGIYADYTDAPNYEEAMMQIAEANSMFESVPARIRAEFNNNPGEFIDFMSDPENRDAIEALGLDASHLGGNEEKTSAQAEEPNQLPSSGGEADLEAQPPPAAVTA